MTASGEDGGVDRQSYPTGTVSFLFTDVVGSTAAWEDDRDVMAAVIGRIEELHDAAATSGVRAVEQGAGDSAVIAFEGPSEAARAALDLQLAMIAEPWPTVESMQVRAALHLGEVSWGRGGSYRGPTMNRCGRLLAACHGGQVIASGSFVSVLEESGGGDTGELSWVDLGAHTLAGVQAPMRVWQLAHPELAGGFPPLRTPEGRGLHLPAPTTPLIGRDDELSHLSEKLGTGRSVTVLGPGGSGKTRLALEMAHRSLLTDVDVEWIDLTRSADPDGIDQVVVAELGLHHGPGDLRHRVVEHLRSRRVLLVLDNC